MIVFKGFFLSLCYLTDYYNTSIRLGKREQCINTALENYAHFEIHTLPESAIKINYPT